MKKGMLLVVHAMHVADREADFPSTESILLEENYRSTASILKASLAIVSQGEMHACQHA